MENKINITSTLLEKGVDLAKDFLDKLILPAVEETGLLIKEKVTFWKFQNQVKMLNKAKDYCEKHGIEPKTISFKLLVPLLETSALEEDAYLQNKWAVLLGNMVDSEQNIENHVFPYILGQISKKEYLIMEQVVEKKQQRVKDKTQELENFILDRPKLETELVKKISYITLEIETERAKISTYYNDKIRNLTTQKETLDRELTRLKIKEGSIRWGLKQPEEIPEENLREFEISNLSRLGLVKYIQENFANSQTLEIPNNHEEDYLSVDVDIEVEYDESHILTELGELFINACTEKK